MGTYVCTQARAAPAFGRKDVGLEGLEQSFIKRTLTKRLLLDACEHLYACPCICLYTCLSTCLYTCLCIHSMIHMSIHVSIHMSIRMSVQKDWLPFTNDRVKWMRIGTNGFSFVLATGMRACLHTAQHLHTRTCVRVCAHTKLVCTPMAAHMSMHVPTSLPTHTSTCPHVNESTLIGIHMSICMSMPMSCLYKLTCV